MSARDKFLHAVIDQIGKPVLMGHLDCSELVAIGIKAAGGPNQSATHTAQRYHDETRKLLLAEQPTPGDLGFYGLNDSRVVHVVIYLAGGHVLSADGATHAITDLETARAHGAAVRVHPGPAYRHDVPFLGFHRNTVVDSIDFVQL